jgi:hypothetical protein
MGDLEAVFRRRKVLSMAVVKDVVGTDSRMTAFRRLRALPYRSSYSHRGKYYTLDDIPEYDPSGVWVFDAVCFSRHGTLLSTVEALVDIASSGRTAAELGASLHVRVQNALKVLADRGRLLRRQIGHEYVYVVPGKSVVQLAARKRAVEEGLGGMPTSWSAAPEETAEHLTTFLSVLNEKQRRLYLGFESLKIGRGGDAAVASSAGVNVKTVARGRQELAAKEVTLERVRAAGAGRPPLKKTT